MPGHAQDLVIPNLKHPAEFANASPLVGHPQPHRDILFLFRGDVGKNRLPHYSRCRPRRTHVTPLFHLWRSLSSMCLQHSQNHVPRGVLQQGHPAAAVQDSAGAGLGRATCHSHRCARRHPRRLQPAPRPQQVLPRRPRCSALSQIHAFLVLLQNMSAHLSASAFKHCCRSVLGLQLSYRHISVELFVGHRRLRVAPKNAGSAHTLCWQGPG